MAHNCEKVMQDISAAQCVIFQHQYGSLTTDHCPAPKPSLAVCSTKDCFFSWSAGWLADGSLAVFPSKYVR